MDREEDSCGSRMPCDEEIPMKRRSIMKPGIAEGWVSRLPKVPANRKYVIEARSMATLDSIPPTKKAICENRETGKSLGPDSKVPEPSELHDEIENRPKYMLSSYSNFVNRPDMPPNENFPTWEGYTSYVAGLKYLSSEWMAEHEKFMTASSMGKAAGIDPKEAPERYWSRCRRTFSDKRTWFVEYILSRGLCLEPFVKSLYSMLCDGRGMTVCELHTMINKEERWIMTTPDIGVCDPKTGEIIRIGEIKCPAKRRFLTIPPEYMMQMQFTMWTVGVRTCDFMSLELDDKKLVGTFIVYRVWLNDEYIRTALPVLKSFCRAVLTGTKPPSRGSFIPPEVKTEQIAHLSDVVHIVPGGEDMVKEALRNARIRADAEMARISVPKMRVLSQSDEPIGDISRDAFSTETEVLTGVLWF